jgi:hypothetical protein
MATFTIPKTKQIIQIHPRVLKEDRNCCECMHSSELTNITPTNELYCSFHLRNTNRYDECPAYEKERNPK